MRVLAALIVCGVLCCAAAQRAEAAPACGIRYLPFEEGVEWDYELIATPPTDDPAMRARQQFHNVPAPSVTIRVLSVDKTREGTEIRLEETTGKQVRETLVRCTTAELMVPPQSFFFAGEPGGGLLIELSNIVREGKSLPGKAGFKKNDRWVTELKADVVRKAHESSKLVLKPAKLELERTLLVGTIEEIASNAATAKAMRVSFELAGRVTLEGSEHPVEMPAGSIGDLWFASGLGLIQVQNAAGHLYQLRERRQPE